MGTLIGLGMLLLPAMHLTEPSPGPRWEPPGLFITVYDWGMGGINCDDDCSTTALTTTGDELLGWTAACPSAWLGHVTTTVVTIWGQEFVCVDAFGRPEDRVLTTIDGRSVYRIDIAYRPATDHPWNMEYVPYRDWSRRWMPMQLFQAMRTQQAADLVD